VVRIEPRIIKSGIKAVGHLPVIRHAIPVPVHADRAVKGVLAMNIDILQLI
jgi:hypothetical protein